MVDPVGLLVEGHLRNMVVLYFYRRSIVVQYLEESWQIGQACRLVVHHVFGKRNEPIANAFICIDVRLEQHEFLE